MNKKTAYLCPVVERRILGDNHIVLTLACPEIAGQAQPGQFVNISVNQFLRRPLGIMQVDRQSGHIRVGIRIQGEGTAWLANRAVGDELSVLGPLGHGFTLAGYERIITVGGGTGVFPLYFVQQACREQKIEGIAVCGYRSSQESILADEFAETACQVLFASDAGDMMVAGHAALALEQLLDTLRQQDGERQPKTAIMTCGPKIMMQAVAAIARRRKMSCQVSLEERMACGIGVCLVCICKVRSDEKDRPLQHKRCCVEGPVFPAEEVIW